ncbi:hypothetical protein CIP101434_00666 [Corynebacterium diphtheriae]|nr:hypothetical protein CIP101280_00376 [Corynebacterium diphtheriae]CAB0497955.1 hypothetical protein CIP101434_00666 [Corynebacterium diphtheriae]
MVVIFLDRRILTTIRCGSIPPVAYDLLNEPLAAGINDQFPTCEEAINGADTIKDVVIGGVVGDPPLLQFLAE